MKKKGLTQIALLLIIGFIILVFFIVRNQLGIIGSTPDIKDKIAAIDCGNDDFCGTPDDLNSDDTLIFEEGHKIDTVIQLVPVNLCSNRDPNGIVGCGTSGVGLVRKLENVSVKLDGRLFNVRSDRLLSDNGKRIDRKLEIFYTWQVNYNNDGRYYYDFASGSYAGYVYPDNGGYRLCLEQGFCKKEYGSIIFRVEPSGQGATTTIPVTSSTSTILKPGETTIMQKTTTTIIQEDARELSLFDRIRNWFRRLFSRIGI